MQPIFQEEDFRISLPKMAYDLSLAYAKTKLEYAKEHEPELFEYGPAPQDIEELEYLHQQFHKALAYYAELNPRTCQSYFDDASK